ncbi:MAG TPA: S1/P1 nuclease [Bryobacteraceae bacterium]
MRYLTAIALVAGCVPAFAWGPEGHRLVARIAWEQLTPAVRERVAAILAPDQTLPSIASWADEIRRARPDTAPWHYIDIPIEKSHLDMTRDCAKGDCVIAKIPEMRKTLQDPAATAIQKREALMFLVHMVGDMHQPLHCSDHEDRGGNSVRVIFFDKQSNLHSVWDSGLIGRLPNEEELFPELSRTAAQHAKKWSKGTVEGWAEQSHKVAQKLVYGKLPKVADGTPVPLDATYETLADPAIKLQIERAGDRLAKVLNETLR